MKKVLFTVSICLIVGTMQSSDKSIGRRVEVPVFSGVGINNQQVQSEERARTCELSENALLYVYGLKAIQQEFQPQDTKEQEEIDSLKAYWRRPTRVILEERYPEYAHWLYKQPIW